MIEGGGHYLHAQDPDQVATVVIGFLKEHHSYDWLIRFVDRGLRSG
jgi:hypothetical protein